MAIQFNCPFCTAPIRVPDAAGGKRGRCPKCKTKLKVPKPEIPAAISPAKPKAGKTRGRVAAEPTPSFDGIDEDILPEPSISPAIDPVPTTASKAVPIESLVEPDDLLADRFAAPVASPPAAVRPPTSYARLLKRRRSRRGWFWVPVFLGVLLVGGIAGWFFWQSGSKLRGELKAVQLVDEELKPRTLGYSDIDMDEYDVDRVLEYFKKDNHPIGTLEGDRGLMLHEVESVGGGLEIRVFETKSMAFYRVNIAAEKPLLAYYKKHRKSLQKRRDKTLKSAATKFFKESLKTVEDEQRGSPDYDLFRRDVAINVHVGGLGFHLVAIVDNTRYPCIYEDDEAIYFLLPKGIKSFQLKGRKFDDGTTPFPGRYTVKVTPANQPSKTTPKTKSSTEPEKSPTHEDSGTTDPMNSGTAAKTISP
ncbi:MAG: hypothetical protein IID45_08575 [Planctomycetes bacterium]|nr:hypothetical protein [Planctomycetota bacterium]